MVHYTIKVLFMNNQFVTSACILHCIPDFIQMGVTQGKPTDLFPPPQCSLMQYSADNSHGHNCVPLMEVVAIIIIFPIMTPN